VLASGFDVFDSFIEWSGKYEVINEFITALIILAFAFSIFTMRRFRSEFAERKRAEEARQKTFDELEMRVEERTAELTKANEELQISIIERKRAEEERQKTAIELENKAREFEEANKELKETAGQFVLPEKVSAPGTLTRELAHELKQPLNDIKIISQSILVDIRKNRFAEEELEQDLNEVVNQVNRMAEIIDHARGPRK